MVEPAGGVRRESRRDFMDVPPGARTAYRAATVCFETGRRHVQDVGECAVRNRSGSADDPERHFRPVRGRSALGSGGRRGAVRRDLSLLRISLRDARSGRTGDVVRRSPGGRRFRYFVRAHPRRQHLVLPERRADVSHEPAQGCVRRTVHVHPARVEAAGQVYDVLFRAGTWTTDGSRRTARGSGTPTGCIATSGAPNCLWTKWKIRASAFRGWPTVRQYPETADRCGSRRTGREDIR